MNEEKDKVEQTSGSSKEEEFKMSSEIKLPFNLGAAPFQPPPSRTDDENTSSTINIGPSRVPVNARIWDTVASPRVMPVLPRGFQAMPPLQSQMSLRRIPQAALYNPLNMYSGYQSQPPPFEEDYSRNAVFTRNFGPIAHPDGFIEVRLRENISVLISLDRSILLSNLNSNVKIAVSSGNMMAACMEHPNGKVYQQFERVDIMTFDGSKKLNRFVRYAKMWEKGISLTADGCALIYLVDQAGTRTTSDAVNKDIRTEYCWQVFAQNARIGAQYYNEADAASKNYHFFTQEDGTQVFDIIGFRVAQTPDGMVRIARAQNRLKIHTSPTNGSATLTTPNIHCTASMGQSSHLFVRREERRMHFDGTSFVVRNAGHSAGFDESNNLRVY